MTPTEESSRFLASTLHEVRTPIQTIISTLELLQDTELNEEQHEYTHQIEISANSLLQLANDILDFTKIRTDNFVLEKIPFDLIDLAENVCELVSIEAFSKGLEIITDIDFSLPSMVMGDQVRVQQIVLNLLKNAVKFTSSGFVILKISAHKNKYLLFEIIDSGIGVPAEKQKEIFNEYYQVDASTTRKYGGTGLGLSICQNLVRIMGGKIGVISSPGKGSNFWFTIPLEVSEFSSKAELNFKQNPKVLLVDNSPILLRTLKNKFLAMGVKEIETCTNGNEAIKILNTHAQQGNPFSLVLIDMLMPQIDGWHLGNEIRNSVYINQIKLYMTVPEGQMKNDAKMKLMNWFDGYIYKPIKRTGLLKILSNFTSEPVTLENELTSEQINEVQNDTQIAAGQKILIAEDHPVNRKIMVTFLKKYGAQVFEAENGEEAVKQVEQNPDIDLIFMDILMPVKSGIDATVELKKKNFSGIIIACTANNNPADFEQYTKIGINDILLKPFKRDAVKQIIEKWKSVLSFDGFAETGKSIIQLTEMNKLAEDLWNINDLLDTTDGDIELSVSLMDDYIDQTELLLKKLEEELNGSKDIKNIELYSHTLKGSSAAVSVDKLFAIGKEMNDAAKAGNLVNVEAARTEFAINFVSLKNIVKIWKANL